MTLKPSERKLLLSKLKLINIKLHELCERYDIEFNIYRQINIYNKNEMDMVNEFMEDSEKVLEEISELIPKEENKEGMPISVEDMIDERLQSILPSISDSVLNQVSAITEKLELYFKTRKPFFDKNGDNRISKEEWRDGFKTIGRVLVYWLSTFAILAGILSIIKIEDIKLMIEGGTPQWDWIWSNIVSLALSGVYGIYKNSKNQSDTKTKMQISTAQKKEQEAVGKLSIMKQAHDIEKQSLLAESQIRLAYQELKLTTDLTEKDIESKVHSALARLEIEKNKVLKGLLGDTDIPDGC